MTKVSSLGVRDGAALPSLLLKKPHFQRQKRCLLPCGTESKALLAEILARDWLIFTHESLIVDVFPLCFEEGAQPRTPQRGKCTLSLHHTLYR